MDVVYFVFAIVVAYTVGFFVGRWAYIRYGDHSLIKNQPKKSSQSATADDGFEDRPKYHGGAAAVG